MKSLKYLLATALALVALGVAAQGRLRWLNPNHHFGTFSEDLGAVACEFMGVNDGDSAVVVMDVRANCGCTRPVYSREPVQPGDTLKVSVTYDANGRPGRFNKQVKVTTNAVNSPSVLTLQGTVIGNTNTLSTRYPIEAGRARLSNEIASFGATRKGRVLAAAVNIYNITNDTIFPQVRDLPANINAVFSPKQILPGEQGSLSLTAYTDRTDEWGIVNDSLTLIPDSRYPDLTKSIETVMVINEDFTKLTPEQRAAAPVLKVSDDAVDFDRFASDGKKAVRTITLRNQGKSPMLVRQMLAADPAVTLQNVPQKIAPGKTAIVKIVVDRSKLPADGVLNAKINLMVNDPENPNKTIRITGIDHVD